MPNEPALSRSGESSPFGKSDAPLTINLSAEAIEELQAMATFAHMPLGEFMRTVVVEPFLWGHAQIMARLLQKRMPLGIGRIT